MTAWPAAFPGELHRYQIEALSRLDGVWATGVRHALIVLPPGAGKTVVGLEAIRRLGRPAVVLSPNTAIQGQWAAQWRAYEGSEEAAIGSDRSLTTPLTSITYQSVATFDADDEVDADGGARAEEAVHLDRLTDEARAFVDRLAGLGEITLVLDECHHLLEVWGRLLGEILGVLPAATVIGLTATPPSALTPEQAALVAQLFGPPVYSVSIPAAVRDGRLAPYAELAYLVTPTAAESDWLASEAERFLELQTDLAHPDFAATAFLPWLDARVGRVGSGEWPRLEKDRPDLAAALLRFHGAGLCGLPSGARLREEHRHAPRADDWAAVIGGYVEEALRESADPRDEAALVTLRNALPSIGFHLTRAGVRRGASPVDRVLARSEAKATAAVEVIAAERRNLGMLLRALVLCDYERATATLPARLVGVIDQDAGSAMSVLDCLASDAALAGLGIALVTGRTVAANAPAAAAIMAAAADAGVALQPVALSAHVDELRGTWSARQWVRIVTGLFDGGPIAVLVGTRGLLGEGWDARSVTTLVDLSAATTPTAVVQTRGRALRLDPQWPEKVAHAWSVVCIDHAHPRGWQDWDRFVRKHDGYLGIDAAGDVVAGVGHVAAGLSPYEPPPPGSFDHVNATMLVRAEDRPRTRDLWRIGEPYADELVPLVRIRRTSAGPPAPEPRLPATPDLLADPTGIVRAAGRRGPRPDRASTPVLGSSVLVAVAIVAVLAVTGAPAWSLCALLAPALAVGLAVRAGGRRAVATYREVVGDPGVSTYASVIADALHEAGLCGQSAVDVRYRVDADGVVGVHLPGPAAAAFATALDEVLGPPAQPRYVIGRPRLPALPPTGSRSATRTARAAFRRHLDVPQVPHAVPAVFGVNAQAAGAFSHAWHRWLASTDPLFTGSPQGAGLLASADGRSPTDCEVQRRTCWE